MPITEHRYITIEQRIITLSDVRKLANELHSIYKKRRKDKKKKFDIEAYCNEKVVFTSADPQIFADDSPIVSKRVWRIEMGLYIEPSEAIKVKLTHNPSQPLDNQISVIGNDSNWVNGTLKKLEEIVDSFSPQNTIIRRYSKALAVILALTIGLFFFNIITLVFAWLAPSSPNITLSQQTLELLRYYKIPIAVTVFLAKYALALSIGGAPAASVVAWMVGLFPMVELQIGPEYKLIEKRRRKLIVNTISITGIVSLLAQIVFDVALNLSF
jgi:hypothetical protein